METAAKCPEERLAGSEPRALRNRGDAELRRLEEVDRDGELATLHVLRREFPGESTELLAERRWREREL
jgi:hypothetical protein